MRMNLCFNSVIIARTSSINHDTFDTFYWTNITLPAAAAKKSAPIYLELKNVPYLWGSSSQISYCTSKYNPYFLTAQTTKQIAFEYGIYV